jgi:hypothetical protein
LKFEILRRKPYGAALAGGRYYYADDNHGHIKEDESRGDNGGDNRKELAAVIDNSQYAKHQGGRERTHYQQSSKDCKRTASPRPKASKSNKRCDGYDDKESRYFSKTHFELFSGNAETKSSTLSAQTIPALTNPCQLK